MTLLRTGAYPHEYKNDPEKLNEEEMEQFYSNLSRNQKILQIRITIMQK